MSEQQNARNGEQQGPQFSMQRVYVKDLSFESPKAPEVFRASWKPQINLELNTRNNSVGDRLYEVVLCLTITARNEAEEVVFLAEVHQAGIFQIDGMAPAQLNQTLGSFCPSVLFPYARETIDSLVTRGSFPPLMLAPVNFDAIYAESQKRRAEMEGAEHVAH